ncbi:hypothetical protein AABC03_10700 [Staphylococcus nepalensis]|uniref:hypothetical protein n=1 Tax=Staphylococcus nepalensis TaxID=214473 RepID=UPI000D58AA11|nr:hypothetical protein [Staphylococcus nepalensis]AWI44133.1 hypothetical protein BJG88_04795 [Staphylococcus nepalensis]
MDLNEEIELFKKMVTEIFQRYQLYSLDYESSTENKINFRKKCVHHFLDDNSGILDETLLKEIDFFKSIVSQEDSDILVDEELTILNTDRRIKNDRSIYDKLLRYRMGEEAGAIPVRKCLNDLLGYRFIFRNNMKFDDLFKLIKGIVEQNPTLSSKVDVKNSTKKGYRGIHLYFKGQSNHTFPCELQVWKYGDDKSNNESHKKYKRRYLEWEENENMLHKLERGE